MDITVSIPDYRSLSQSDLIMKNLFSMVQIGKTSHSGRGVIVQDTKFVSGTIENPLIVTLKNSQTETVMYVRNIPISSVHERNGLLEQWVAVYPPGDPQNLHFDATATPKEGCPAVFISVKIEEDLSVTSSASHLRPSLNFAPLPRQNDEDEADRLRDSLSSLQGELARARRNSGGAPSSSPDRRTRFSVDGGGLGSLPEGRSANQGSGAARGATSRGASSRTEEDSTVREKELQAKRIKEHFSQLSNAQRTAHDKSRSLQDNARMLSDLKKQFKDLEMQCAEQRAATQILERDCETLRGEEAQLQEKIRQRNLTFQELRDNRDEIDRELSRALGESERQKSMMEASSKDFASQTQSMACDLDESKRQVSQLQMTLKQKELMVADSERRVTEEIERVAVSEAAEREAMRQNLDKTRCDLAGAKTELEAHERRCRAAEQQQQEARTRLAGIESEVASLQNGGGALGLIRGQAGDVKADLELKREKLKTQSSKVKKLEEELSDNRGQLDQMNLKISELHTEAHEKELAAKRCEDLRADLERRLDEQRGMTTTTKGQSEVAGSRLFGAEQELAQARAALQGLEDQAAAAEEQRLMEARGSERNVEQKREELAKAQQEASIIQKACEELEATSSQRRSLLEQRNTALMAAQARVSDLTRQLSEAAAELAETDARLARADSDAADKRVSLEEARKRLRERQEEISMMQEETVRTVDLGKSRVADLDATAMVKRAEVQQLVGGKSSAEEQRLELEGALAANKESIARLQEEIDALLLAKREGEEEVSRLSEQNDAMAAEYERSCAELERLQGTSDTHQADLEATRGRVLAKKSEVAELEEAYRRETESLESDAAALTAEHAESQVVNGQLRTELDDMQSECAAAADSVSAGHREKDALNTELEQTLAEHATVRAQEHDRLQLTEARAQDAATRLQRSKQRREEAATMLQEVEGQQREISTKIAAAREEARSEGGRLQEVELQVAERNARVASLRQELDLQRAEGARFEELKRKLEEENSDVEAKLRALEPQKAEAVEIARRHAQLFAEERAEEERHMEAIARRELDINDARRQLQQQGADLVQKKNEEIERQMDLINKLETDRANLIIEEERLKGERGLLEARLREMESARVEQGGTANRSVLECVELEATVNHHRSTVAQLQQQEVELERILAELSQKENALRSEAENGRQQVQKLEAEMEAYEQEASREIEAESNRLGVLLQERARNEGVVEQLRIELGDVTAEVGLLLRDCELTDSRVEELHNELQHTRQNLVIATAERDEAQRLVIERSAEVARYSREREQRTNKVRDIEKMQQTVQEFEETLQRLSDQLVEAQEAVRRRKNEEEEFRFDIQKLTEQIRATSDQLSYQVEHGNLQFESIQKLEEQKNKSEQEVELLTLGLHDAEQRNESLQKDNLAMQEQVEGIYKGSLREWAAEVHRVKYAAEVQRYQEEINVWKQKSEEMRKDKQVELSRLLRQHEDTVRSLRERIVSVELQIEQAEQTVKRREAAMVKKQEQGESAASAPGDVPGLVVPTRPLQAGHDRRKALLVGVNYALGHAPLKGCVNDVWNLQCLLRYTLQYREDQLQLLLDCADGRPPRLDRAPTKANILAGLQWLISGAQPGDNLLFVFCGYGTQHPRAPGSDQYEAYLVPADFASDLPSNFFAEQSTNSNSRYADRDRNDRTPEAGGYAMGGLSPQKPEYRDIDEGCPGYRLVSLAEVNDHICRLPKNCRMSVVLDCCYSVIPSVSPASNFPPTFPKVTRGRIDYSKLRDFISRPRFLELPVIPVRHTPSNIRASAFPSCWLHSYSGCRLDQWCAEFPIEGTVQGAFSWAFLKALAKGHYHCGMYQFQQILIQLMQDLKVHFKGCEQTPLLQFSQSASMQDVVLWT